MLHATVEATPDREALVEIGGPRLRYQEFWDRATRVAGGLAGDGVVPGDRVGIRLGNGVDWALAFFGAQLRGAIAAPGNTRFTDEGAPYVIDDSGPALVSAGPLPHGAPTVIDDAEPRAAAATFSTSGTTGFPTRAIPTH